MTTQYNDVKRLSLSCFVKSLLLMVATAVVWNFAGIMFGFASNAVLAVLPTILATVKFSAVFFTPVIILLSLWKICLSYKLTDTADSGNAAIFSFFAAAAGIALPVLSFFLHLYASTEVTKFTSLDMLYLFSSMSLFVLSLVKVIDQLIELDAEAATYP